MAKVFKKCNNVARNVLFALSPRTTIRNLTRQRRSLSVAASEDPFVIPSIYSDVKLPENPNLPQYLFDAVEPFGDRIALVSHFLND